MNTETGTLTKDNIEDSGNGYTDSELAQLVHTGINIATVVAGFIDMWGMEMDVDKKVQLSHQISTQALRLCAIMKRIRVIMINGKKIEY